MYTTLFVISFIGIVLLLILKTWQMRRGHILSLSQLISRGDALIHYYYALVKQHLLVYRHVLKYIIVEYIPYHTYKFLFSMTKVLQERYREVVRGIHRKYVLKNNDVPSVSSFWTRIANHPHNNPVGKGGNSNVNV